MRRNRHGLRIHVPVADTALRRWLWRTVLIPFFLNHQLRDYTFLFNMGNMEASKAW